MSEETPRAVTTHRPLPSVDMPLLRDERRSIRNKQLLRSFALFLGIAAGVAAALLVPRWLGWTGGEDEGSARADAPRVVPNHRAPASPPVIQRPANEPPPAPVAEPLEPMPAVADGEPRTAGAVSRVTRAFGSGRGFRDAVRAGGASRDEALALIAALEDVMDFRHCRPTDMMTFERDESGTLVRFEYRAGLTEQYAATLDSGGRLRGERIQVPVDRTRLARGGGVQTSLGDALDGLGLGRTLVGAFVEVFDGRIAFSAQTRVGDAFRIIVDEERVNGTFLRYGTVHALEYVGQRAGRHRAYWYEEEGGRGDWFDATGRALHGGWLRTPLRYDSITSGFNPRRMHPVLRRIMPHNGVDYAAAPGTPVWAAAEGTVTSAGPRGANGNLVTIRHENGMETGYAHLLRIQSGIRPGAQVRQRDIIGAVGSTGRSTGPHLHFSLKRGGRFIDPISELNGPGRLLPAAQMTRYRRHVRRLDQELERISVPEVAVGGSAAADDPPAPDVPQD